MMLMQKFNTFEIQHYFRVGMAKYNGKSLETTQTEEWMNTLIHIHNITYYKGVKMNELQLFTTWMNLRSIQL